MYKLSILVLLVLACSMQGMAQDARADFFIGLNGVQFIPAGNETGYESKFSNLPTPGLSLGVTFPAGYSKSFTLHSGLEVNIHRQNVSYSFTGTTVTRQNDYSVRMLNLLIPVKFYWLNKPLKPLKIYTQTGFNVIAMDRGNGVRVRNRLLGPADSLYWKRDEVEISGPVNIFRLVAIPLEMGFMYAPKKWGPSAVSLSGGLFLTPITQRDIGVTYKSYWIAAKYHWRFFDGYEAGF